MLNNTVLINSLQPCNWVDAIISCLLEDLVKEVESVVMNSELSASLTSIEIYFSMKDSQ